MQATMADLAGQLRSVEVFVAQRFATFQHDLDRLSREAKAVEEIAKPLDDELRRVRAESDRLAGWVNHSEEEVSVCRRLVAEVRMEQVEAAQRHTTLESELRAELHMESERRAAAIAELEAGLPRQSPSEAISSGTNIDERLTLAMSELNGQVEMVSMQLSSESSAFRQSLTDVLSSLSDLSARIDSQRTKLEQQHAECSNGMAHVSTKINEQRRDLVGQVMKECAALEEKIDERAGMLTRDMADMKGTVEETCERLASQHQRDFAALQARENDLETQLRSLTDGTDKCTSELSRRIDAEREACDQRRVELGRMVQSCTESCQCLGTEVSSMRMLLSGKSVGDVALQHQMRAGAAAP